MQQPSRSTSRLSFVVAFAAAVVVVLLACWLAVQWWPARPTTPPDPRLAIESPFLNVRPDVQYVGDAVCASCHQDIADAYRGHPMGQAMHPTASAPPLEGYSPSGEDSFQVGRLLYQVTRKGEKVLHAEALLDSNGAPVARLEAEAQFAVGSGTRGRTYLINRGGYLFESPISWYTQKQKWDLSPGYEKMNSHFERPIMSGCLYCHCNLAHPDPNTMNRYDPPYFTGFVIGCERCHGPGQLHAEKPRRTDGVDYTIVNPKHLPPLLREDVCQQCHLQGEERVLKVGREQFDYRPGLPLHAFQAVFVKPPQLTKGQKAVTQVEQMHASRCFVGSKETLGCTSCHDPHRVPGPENKAAYYRQRCLECHDKQPCSVPEAARRSESAEDSCILCHMPRLQSNIAHTALTDHRVPRSLKTDDHAREEDVLSGGSFVPLQLFHVNQVDGSSPEAGRDLGVAIADLSRRIEGQAPIVPFVRRAQPLLEAGLNLWPNDPRGWDALGYCYRKQGRLAEAEKAYHNSLRHAPEREHTLLELVELALQSRRIKEAIAYKERLIQVNPQYSIYYLKLADLLHQDGQWTKSNLACDNALRLNLVHNDARRLKVVNFLRLGQPEEAQREFEQLVRASPGERTALETWFDSQKRQR